MRTGSTLCVVEDRSIAIVVCHLGTVVSVQMLWTIREITPVLVMDVPHLCCLGARAEESVRAVYAAPDHRDVLPETGSTLDGVRRLRALPLGCCEAPTNCPRMFPVVGGLACLESHRVLHPLPLGCHEAPTDCSHRAPLDRGLSRRPSHRAGLWLMMIIRMVLSRPVHEVDVFSVVR